MCEMNQAAWARNTPGAGHVLCCSLKARASKFRGTEGLRAMGRMLRAVVNTANMPKHAPHK